MTVRFEPDTGVVTFDDPWPQDRQLDPFRDAVWELSRVGLVEAYLTCQVVRMRSFPFRWVRREWRWYQVQRSTGSTVVGIGHRRITAPSGTPWLSWSKERLSTTVAVASVSMPRLLMDPIETGSGSSSVPRTSSSWA
jgi:hypothetical protein